MKKILFILIAATWFCSCQKDEVSVTQNPVSGITSASPLALLISRVTQNETHCDDVLDGSSCFSVRLPVTVTVNGQQVTLTSEDDCDAIEALQDQSANDDDIVHFAFPITIVFADFHELIVTSQEQLNGISCGDDDFNEIRCIDFNFPISINTYNTTTQVANVVTIENDTQLYAFINNVSGANLITIAYPITLTLSNGQTQTISSDNDLENAIEDAIDDCDDDDGGGQQPLELKDIIILGTWRVSYCSGASNYDGYNFTFLSNGTVTAVKANETSQGTWQLFDDEDHLKMELNFANPALGGLVNDEWKVTEYNNANFRLKEDHHGSGGGSGGENEYVYFTKN
jgi:hypothetical protein